MNKLEELKKDLDRLQALIEDVLEPEYTKEPFDNFRTKFTIYCADLELPVGEWLIKNAKTLSDLFWENNIEWNEWLRMGVTEAKQIALAPKYQGKWVSVPEIQARSNRNCKQLENNLQRLTDILALPNMGDEGRKTKLVAIKAWEINLRKDLLLGKVSDSVGEK
jgi:hypothetical protein